MPRVRKTEADAEIMIYNIHANLAWRLDPRARASTGPRAALAEGTALHFPQTG
jgi:hypothetical protein